MGYFSMDNASNNHTTMVNLLKLLKKRHPGMTFTFDPVANRICCFAHIINLCTQAVIKALNNATMEDVIRGRSKDKQSPDNPDNSDNDDTDTDTDTDNSQDPQLAADAFALYARVLPAGPFSSKKPSPRPLDRARTLVTTIRKSGKRRDGLQQAIIEGNNNGYFRKPSPIPGQEPVAFRLPLVQLLRDVPTRWDSTYYMLERLQILRPVSCEPSFFMLWF